MTTKEALETLCAAKRKEKIIPFYCTAIELAELTNKPTSIVLQDLRQLVRDGEACYCQGINDWLFWI